jgi:large subunit ribosomal protein L18
MATAKVLRRERIKKGILKRVSGTTQKPRLSVFRSNAGIYAQIIDDVTGRTLVSASTVELKDVKAPKSELSKKVGQKIAEKAQAAGISTIVFDRNGYLYHGRVKALADGAREGGLKF